MKNKEILKIVLLSLLILSINIRLYSLKTGNFETSIIYGGAKHSISY